MLFFTSKFFCQLFTASVSLLAVTFIPRCPNQSMKSQKALRNAAPSASSFAHTLKDMFTILSFIAHYWFIGGIGALAVGIGAAPPPPLLNICFIMPTQFIIVS